MNKLTVVLLLLCVNLSFFACNDNKAVLTTVDVDKVQEDIIKRETFESPKAIPFIDTSNLSITNPYISDNRFLDTILAEVTEFYKLNGYKTRWLYSKKHVSLFDSYVKVLKESKNIGLNPETYGLTALLNAEKDLYNGKYKEQDLFELDKQITASFFLFTKHITEGRVVDPSNGNKIWKRDTNKENEVDFLLKLKDNEDITNLISSLQPQTKVYKDLSNKLADLYKNNEDSIVSFSINDLDSFKVGYSSENIVHLRNNLKFSGYSIKNDSATNTVDSALIKTIMLFQDQHGIVSDGLPGKNTLKYLNMQREDKIDRIVLNLERLRWLNKDFGDEYIIVNIPQYELFYNRDGKREFECKVIVGKEYNSTPIFMDELEYLEFRPTWTVPQSIINNEFIPNLRRDANYYTRRGFKVYENGAQINPTSVNWNSNSVYKRYFRFVEQPSERNALGLVKFIFPNSMHIYLHDTPTDYLFDRNKRALSHGCVRVEKPAELAYKLLENNEKKWTMEEVESAMNTGDTPQRVYLDNKVLVQLIYITTYVNDEGQLIVRNDIYGHDDNQLKLLKENYGVKYSQGLK